MLEGAKVRDLQRLSGPVLAGVLPRLYPRMLELAYEHQDEGRPIFICTAAAQEMAELLAMVLTFDGAVGSVAEVIDGVYTGREAARSTIARARRRRCASWPSARTSTSPRATRTATASPTCRCCGSSAILSPSIRTRSSRAWRARRGGRSCGSSDSAGSCAYSAAAAVGGGAAAAPVAVRR